MSIASLDLRDLPHGLRAMVSDELDRDEEVVWMGRPDPRAFARQALPFQLFAIPWTAFAVFWIGSAADWKVPDFQNEIEFFPLFGLFPLLAGVGMLTSPMWFRRLASRTVYVITERRAIVFAGKFARTAIRSWPPRELRGIERKQRSDGTGDLILDHDVRRIEGTNTAAQEVGFLGVRDVKPVHELLLALANTADES